MQWTVKVGATVGVKAEASLNAATGGSTMMTSDDDQEAAEDRAKETHGDVGGPALGLWEASASAIAEAGHDAEWVFVRDTAPRMTVLATLISRRTSLVPGVLKGTYQSIL